MPKQLHDINCVFQGLNEVGGIYISGISGAKNISVLQKYNIKAVVCAARSGFLQYDKSIIEDYLYIPADDYEQFDLSQYFQKAYDFIEKNRKKTNVLVHCMAGISRSVTLVVAYLIKKYGYSVDSILSLLKRKRSIINPNGGFLKQLKSFQNQYECQGEKGSIKKLVNEKTRRQNYFSTSKTLNRRGENQSTDSSRRRTLSKQSKQFLRSFKKKQSNEDSTLFHKKKTSVIGELLQSNEKQNHSRLHFKKQEFYSSELRQNFNMAHVQQEVAQLQIKLQRQGNIKNQQQTDSTEASSPNEIKTKTSVKLQTQKTQTPLSQRLEAIKANLIKSYKLNRRKDEVRFPNQEEKELNLTMALRILKSSKQKKHGDRRFQEIFGKNQTKL